MRSLLSPSALATVDNFRTRTAKHAAAAPFTCCADPESIVTTRGRRLEYLSEPSSGCCGGLQNEFECLWSIQMVLLQTLPTGSNYG